MAEKTEEDRYMKKAKFQAEEQSLFKKSDPKLKQEMRELKNMSHPELRVHFIKMKQELQECSEFRIS